MKRSIYTMTLVLSAIMLACSDEESTVDPDQTNNPDKPTIQNHLSWQGSAIDAAYQKSGKLVCLGYVGKSKYGSSKALRAYRLHNTDSIDAAFDTTTVGKVFKTGIMPDELIMQQDDKMLIDGAFTVEGRKVPLIRLMPDGSLDRPFIDKITLTGITKDIELGPAGEIYVVTMNLKELVKLKADGTVDETFKLQEPFTSSQWYPASLRLLPNGKLLFINDNNIIRLNSDGTKDNSFKFNYDIIMNTPAEFKTISQAFLQKDGKIIINGRFTKFTDRADNTKSYDYLNVARLNADGTLDATFQKSANADGAAAVWLLPDDTFLRTENKEAFTNRWVEILRHSDKDGKTLAEYTINGSIDQVLRLTGNKVVLAGRFFEPYDNIALAFDPYAADNKPIKEISLK